MQEIQSFQIADSIDLKALKPPDQLRGTLYYSDADELLYKDEDGRLIYVFKYGVVSFLDFDEEEIKIALNIIRPYCKNFFETPMFDVFKIQTGARENKLGYNQIDIVGNDVEVIRLVMLNVSQSVSLDYYTDLMEKLMSETTHHTQLLESTGRLGIKGNKLKRYIARSLLLKNRIAENLYIFDSPPETWEDERLNKLDSDLKKTFDLQERSRNIHEGLTIIKDNLELFRDMLKYRTSTILEWIVIVLILIEVLHMIIEQVRIYFR
jgi:required for meiotic nuclear division protein 1